MTEMERVASRHGLTVEGLRQRLRDVRAAKRDDPALCQFCEEALPPSTGRGRRTCTTLCRTSLSRDRAASVAAGVAPW